MNLRGHTAFYHIHSEDGGSGAQKVGLHAEKETRPDYKSTRQKAEETGHPMKRKKLPVHKSVERGKLA